MESVVDQTLGDVAGLDTVLGLQPVAEDHLVHRRHLVGQVVGTLELLPNIVRVENGVFGGLPQSVGTVRHDVGEGADVHSEVSEEHAHTTDGLLAVVFETEGAVLKLGDDRYGKKRLKNLLHRHGSRAGASTSVRGRERLVQVEVHDVNAEVTRAGFSDERVHVRAVHV